MKELQEESALAGGNHWLGRASGQGVFISARLWATGWQKECLIHVFIGVVWISHRPLWQHYHIVQQLLACHILPFDCRSLRNILKYSARFILRVSAAAAAAAKSLQLCPTLCDPIDSSPPGSLIPGSLQARALEWVAISFSNAWKWKVKVKSLSRVQIFETPWTAAYQAPPSMEFSRQEYWSGVPLPSPTKGISFVQMNWDERFS